MSEERKGTWLLTYTGRQYWPADPRSEEVSIYDIAHALSMICRYTGHTKKFYSVAEHSLLISREVPQRLALEGLLHDAAEAYCSDINRPLKQHLPDYKAIEKLNDAAIRVRFGLPIDESSIVKEADTNILYNEYEQVLTKPITPWRWGGQKLPGIIIRGYLPAEGEIKFLERFFELGGVDE